MTGHIMGGGLEKNGTLCMNTATQHLLPAKLIVKQIMSLTLAVVTIILKK
jgi:hypothetical protein